VADDHLTHDPNAGGFVTRLTGKSGDRRQISLQLIVPLVRDGAETTLQLSCPKALASELTLNTSTPVAQASVTNGTLIEHEPDAQDQDTRLRVAGPMGPLRLTWQSGERGASELATVLSAAGTIRVAVDGRSVRSDAALTVQSFGRGFERLRVRLPAGSQLIPGGAGEGVAASPDYRISLEDSNAARDAGDGADSRPVAIIQFAREQQAPVTIPLSTEQPINLEGDVPVELAGFEVIGAVRQYGDIALDVADDWQARWEVGRNVRQVDATDLAATLQQASHTAAFQYDGQPWSLGVRVATRRPRVHVTPRYEIQYAEDEARLALRLNYQISGARVFELRLRLEGWEMVAGSLESAGLVDTDRLFVGEQTLVMPLAQAATPRAEILLSFRRALANDQTRVELPLPVPFANSVGTGDIVLRVANGFQLRADLQNSSGLSAAPAIEEAAEAGGDEDALRLRSLLPEPVVVVDRVQRNREVSTSVVNLVELGPAEAVVEQQLTYDVSYEPIEELLFESPAEFSTDTASLELFLLPLADEGEIDRDTVGTPLKRVESLDDISSSEELVGDQMRFALPTPQLGKFRIAARYTVRRSDEAGVNEWDLPLLRPADGTISDWKAEVQGSRGVAVTLNGDSVESSWEADPLPDNAESGRGVYRFSAAVMEPILPLVTSSVEQNPTAATTIDRVWLQSWYSGNMRQDRAVFHFRTASSQATIELPPRTGADDVEVLVDGQPGHNLSQAAGRIVVRLDSSAGSDDAGLGTTSEHTLELRSREEINQALLTRHRLTPPQLLGARSLSQVYWQIVLPGDVHVVRSPAQMSPSGEWQWLGSFWGRRPKFLQEDLEKWTSASSQMAPAAEHNQYLYTGISPAVSIELITAPRWLIVLTASSAVLAAGLMWLHVPAVRRRWFVAVIACVIAGLAVAYPGPAILLAQASLLGVAVTLVAMVLARLASRPALVPLSISTGSSRYSPARSDSILMPPVVATASTAPTVPLRAPESEQ
jgi:hypothetical protein